MVGISLAKCEAATCVSAGTVNNRVTHTHTHVLQSSCSSQLLPRFTAKSKLRAVSFLRTVRRFACSVCG